jgi:tetratricopeptide (TPR) repeat protein
MNAIRTTAVVAVAIAARSAGAQGNDCAIDQGKPGEVKKAAEALGRAQLPIGSPDDKRKQLRSAVQVLTDSPDKIGNVAGRNLLLGQALSVWLQQPGAGPVMKRGDVGYKANPDGTVDLAAAADSSFDAVEAANPACAATVADYRREPWAKLVNAAATAANAKQLDSAEFYARHAVTIYDKGPHAYNILAVVASQRNDIPGAMTALKQTIDAAGTDTANAELRRSSLVSLAALNQRQAQSATGAEQQALNKEAARLYQEYLKEVPDDAEVQSALAGAISASGDTAAAGSLYAQMTSDPAKYSDLQLFEAATNAANSERRQDAVKLYEAGLQKNPYYRDALYNLSATYFALEQPDKMIPVAKRLVEVDPSNPDSWRLYAGAYQLKQQKAKGPARKVATDSLLALVKKAEAVPARVIVNRFGYDGKQQLIGGTIENLGPKPGTYALKIELLDRTGNVVATETANVGPVEPKASKPFNLAVPKEGIVAYRYAPLN